MTMRDQIATPAGKRAYVRQLFATIADRYDVITRLLSYGRDQRWKARLIAGAALRPSDRVLDLATGTGDLAFAAGRQCPQVVALDVAPRMIELARRKPPPGHRPRFLVGDMGALPFPAETFDVVTTGYGLRNVPDLTEAIDEIARVLKPDGVMLALDFDRPSNPVVRRLYIGYLTLVGGALGWALHRDPDTYRYIPASISRYPGARAVGRLIEARGFRQVRHQRLLGGLMAMHHATK
jgi:ubiquinone/menaquinone biosynthesis methyltransferase